ncbi:MAG: hypothetical protein ACKVP4_03770 [Hyphomicrobium sp.]
MVRRSPADLISRPSNQALRAPGLAGIAAAILVVSTDAIAASPQIRSGATNPVPACVTPDRLMAFLFERNPNIDARFAGIAKLYKHWGEAWRVRWDYAVFQMAIETNFLRFRRDDGSRGDVRGIQNNFAGIGATGRGVSGDRFADVSTGVHAQIQHLVVYSGERLVKPIAPRTIAKQDDIVDLARRLDRAVTFGDLAGRWASDRRYAESIESIAGQYRDRYCRSDAARTVDAPIAPVPRPANQRSFAQPSGLGGPTPSSLAGPQAERAAADSEVLPWAKKPAEPPTLEEPARQQSEMKPSPATKVKSPVRTIWTRKNSNTVKAAAQQPVEQPAAVASEPNESRLEPTSSIAPEAAASGDATFLPLFRIAPAQPSRLGGPVPDLAADALSPSAANARSIPPCRIMRARYGGRKALLLRSTFDGQVRLTALTVIDGFEKSLFETYARAAAPDAEIIGEYASEEEALAEARANCPNE